MQNGNVQAENGRVQGPGQHSQDKNGPLLSIFAIVCLTFVSYYIVNLSRPTQVLEGNYYPGSLHLAREGVQSIYKKDGNLKKLKLN